MTFRAQPCMYVSTLLKTPRLSQFVNYVYQTYDYAYYVHKLDTLTRVALNIVVLLNVTPCSMIYMRQSFRKTSCFRQPCRRKQQDALKLCQVST